MLARVCRLVLVLLATAEAVKVAPNQFLGSCLTNEWVASMENRLGINSHARDALGRLEHPFLQAAATHALNRFADQRTQRDGIYTGSCAQPDATIYGVGTIVDPDTGKVLTPGIVNGSLVIELNGWITHSLTSLVFAIIAQEIYAIPVSFYFDTNTVKMTERMASYGVGTCAPTHLNLEVWLSGSSPALLSKANESYSAGDIGYFGRSGLYTTSDFVNDSMNTTLNPNPLFADFWKGYKFYDKLINAVPVSALYNSSFFPPPEIGCADGSFGCRANCSKSAACTEREANGGECMVVAMMYDYFDPGYLQAVMSNIGIPTYFCFLGYSAVQDFALDAQKHRRPVLFYHYEPDLFHIEHPGVFQRVFLPRPIPERVVLATGEFGENGYGNVNNNLVDVDFSPTKLTKSASKKLLEKWPLNFLASKFALSELELNNLLRKYRNATKDNSTVDATFDAACSWVRENYDEWTKWLDRKPLCTLKDHSHYDIIGCVAQNQTESHRTIVFKWNVPNPDNRTLAADCDGGLRVLPAPILTSRSCEWIVADETRWNRWIETKPACDASFYKYNITGCDKHAMRTVSYWWLLPDPNNSSRSLECIGGEDLPADVRINCDYMPTDSPVYLGVLVVAGIIVLLLVLAVGFVIHYRDMPIIKRSQWEFLVLVVIGGVIICAAAVLYAGKPTPFLCGARPVFTSIGFTTVFGALFVKSLRVYRVFMKTAFKKATVSSFMMAKIFIILVIIDILILGVWFIVDFPDPTIHYEPAREFRGSVDRISCQSASFLFNALLMFWKSIVLFMGLYSSFLIRNVSTDFQESIWMFASTVMVLIGCLVILPLAYLVDMPAAVFYVFLAGCLLLCTSLVMSFMLVPKIHRLHTEASQSSSNFSTQASVKVGDSSRTLVPKSAHKYFISAASSSSKAKLSLGTIRSVSHDTH